MGLKKIISTGILASSLAFLGCDTRSQGGGGSYEDISGVPISVENAYGRLYGHLSTVINLDGEEVLCTSIQSSSRSTHTVSDATSLISSEINDLDEEKIVLTGKYLPKKENDERQIFEFYQVGANGYLVNIRDD